MTPTRVSVPRQPRFPILAAGLCAVLALTACDNPLQPGGGEPPPPPPGVDVGTIRVSVSGLSASATNGGSATVTPTGDTPGEEATVSIPGSGTREWQVAVGTYHVTYQPPQGQTAASATERDVTIEKDAATQLVFALSGTPPDTQGPPPPPPGSPICEATGGGSCYYIHPNGNDGGPGSIADPYRTPQVAVDRAQPGDVIYLLEGTYVGGPGGNGVFIRASAMGDVYGISVSGANGTASNHIILKAYPSQRALLSGMAVEFGGGSAYWRVQDLVIDGGNIEIGGNSHDLFITGNEIFNYKALGGTNPGTIKVLPSSTTGSYNIFIENNTLHDMWHLACEAGTAHCNNPSPTDLPWNEVSDEHMGAFTVMSCRDYGDPCMTGLIEFRNNTVYNMHAAFYFKEPGAGPLYMEGNTFRTMHRIGAWSASNYYFQGNLVYDLVAGPGTPGPGVGPHTRELGEPTYGGQNVNIIGNTFVDINRVVQFTATAQGHTIRDNVFFGLANTSEELAYVRDNAGDSFANNDFNDNCFITTANFVALSENGTTYDLAGARSNFGYETNSVVIAESNKSAVFANPAANDYSLIGAAAQQCAGKGAF